MSHVPCTVGCGQCFPFTCFVLQFLFHSEDSLGPWTLCADDIPLTFRTHPCYAGKQAKMTIVSLQGLKLWDKIKGRVKHHCNKCLLPTMLVVVKTTVMITLCQNNGSGGMAGRDSKTFKQNQKQISCQESFDSENLPSLTPHTKQGYPYQYTCLHHRNYLLLFLRKV